LIQVNRLKHLEPKFLKRCS